MAWWVGRKSCPSPPPLSSVGKGEVKTWELSIEILEVLETEINNVEIEFN